jgi:hypothetical protein
LAATNRRLQHRRREQLEQLERLGHLHQHRKRENPEHREHLEHREHRGHLRQHQENSRHGIAGYILAKRIYPKFMKEGVDYTIKVIELQIDSSDSQLPFHEEVSDAVNVSRTMWAAGWGWLVLLSLYVSGVKRISDAGSGVAG